MGLYWYYAVFVHAATTALRTNFRSGASAALMYESPVLSELNHAR